MTSGSTSKVDVTTLAVNMYGKTAYFRDNNVALRELPQPQQRMSHTLTNELMAVRAVMKATKYSKITADFRTPLGKGTYVYAKIMNAEFQLSTRSAQPLDLHNHSRKVKTNFFSDHFKIEQKKKFLDGFFESILSFEQYDVGLIRRSNLMQMPVNFQTLLLLILK